MKSKVKSHLTRRLSRLLSLQVGFYFTLPAISVHNPALLLEYCGAGGDILCRIFDIVKARQRSHYAA